jgi:hypothetical protein
MVKLVSFQGCKVGLTFKSISNVAHKCGQKPHSHLQLQKKPLTKFIII